MAPGGQWQVYDDIHGVVGNEGEDAGPFAVIANLDPNPNYPEARIVIGPPASSKIDYSGGFCLTYEGAGHMIDRLRTIRRDMEIRGVVPTGTEQHTIDELRKALQCLYLEAPESVVDEIRKRADAVINLITGKD